LTKKKNTLESTTLVGTTPIRPVRYAGMFPGTGIPTLNGIHPVTDDMAHQVSWLMSVAGVPAFPDKEETMKKFHIEALYPGGQYDGTTKNAKSLSDAIDMMLSSRAGGVVARGYIAEVQKGEVRSFELLNGVRV